MKDNEHLEKFIYKIQLIGLKILEKIILLLGLKLSSFVFGLIFMIFGPFTFPSFLAMKNIKKAMPEINFFQRIKIILGMWNNLGRNMAEFVCFNSRDFDDLSKFIYVDNDTIDTLNKIEGNKDGELIFAAHFGNWEIFSKLFSKFNFRFSAVYREMNNKYADKLVINYRKKSGTELIPKGQKGVIKLVRSLKSGNKVFMLVDQRLSNGITVPFFGIPSKTSDAIATFALKNNYKVYSAVAYRRSFSCFFDIKMEEFEVVRTGNLKDDIRATTIKINEQIEKWIKTKPEQWFWVHNRWKK